MYPLSALSSITHCEADANIGQAQQNQAEGQPACLQGCAPETTRLSPHANQLDSLGYPYGVLSKTRKYFIASQVDTFSKLVLSVSSLLFLEVLRTKRACLNYSAYSPVNGMATYNREEEEEKHSQMHVCSAVGIVKKRTQSRFITSATSQDRETKLLIGRPFALL